MPASSQGLPTSGMRGCVAPHVAAGDLHRVDPGPVRRVALELLPALDGALLQLGLAADDLEVRRRLRSRRSAAPGRSSASWRSSSRPCCAASPARAPGRTRGSRGSARVTSHQLGWRSAVHGDEPLVDQPEDELGAAAPADRVAVACSARRGTSRPLLAQVSSTDRLAATSRRRSWPVSQPKPST